MTGLYSHHNFLDLRYDSIFSFVFWKGVLDKNVSFLKQISQVDQVCKDKNI